MKDKIDIYEAGRPTTWEQTDGESLTVGSNNLAIVIPSSVLLDVFASINANPPVGFLLDYTSILDKVRGKSEYAMVKAGVDRAGELAAIKEDDPLLLTFVEEGVDAFIGSIREFVMETHTADGARGMLLVCRFNASFDHILLPSISRGAEAFLCEFALSRWFSIAGRPEAQEAASKAQLLLTQTARQAFSRRKPTPPRNRPQRLPDVIF